MKRLHHLLYKLYLPKLSSEPREHSHVREFRWREFKAWLRSRLARDQGEARSSRMQSEFLLTFLEIVLLNEKLSSRLVRAAERQPCEAFSASLTGGHLVHWKEILCPSGFARLAGLSVEPGAILQLVTNESRTIFCESVTDTGAGKTFNAMTFKSDEHLPTVAWYLQRHFLLMSGFSRSILDPANLEQKFFLPNKLRLWRPRLNLRDRNEQPRNGVLNPVQANPLLLLKLEFNSVTQSSPVLTLRDPRKVGSIGGSDILVGPETPASAADRAASSSFLLPGLLAEVVTLAVAAQASSLVVLGMADIQLQSSQPGQSDSVSVCRLTSNCSNLPARLVLKRISSVRRPSYCGIPALLIS